MPSFQTLRIGSRKSPLALAQAREIQSRLLAAGCGESEILSFKTTGDLRLEGPLAEIGGKGLFTKEIDAALLEGRIDLAVHSMKDMPTILPDGLALAAVPEREDVRDAFLSLSAATLDDLPRGARIGTASLRRAAQLLRYRPDFRIELLRGNVETRLKKLEAGEVDATLLAAAGLKRLGAIGRARSILSTEQMLPAVAQGAIAVLCRADDEEIFARLQKINHPESRSRTEAERALLAVLDGSCRTPIAGLAEIGADGSLALRGLVLETDGRDFRAGEASGPIERAEELGAELGRRLAASLPEGFLSGGGEK